VKNNTESQNPYEVRSLARGLRILENVADSPESQRLTDIASALSVDRATAFRYCSTLTGLGYLHTDPLTKTFTLGPQIRSLGFAAQSKWSWLAVVTKHLPLIAESHNGAASFAVLDGTSILYLDRAVAGKALNQNISTGDRLPAAQTSIGKVLLADLTDKDIRDLFKGSLTRQEILTLIEELEVVRARGWSVNMGNNQPGLNSVAVPVRDNDSSTLLGGINFAGSASEMPMKVIRGKVVPLLIEAADMIATNQVP